MKSSIKKIISAGLIAAICVFAAGCGSSNDSKGDQAKKEIKVGVTAGPHAEIMDEVVKEAAKQGITIKVVEFNDYVQPDKALAEKDLDMNSYQHQPYLDNIVKKQGLKLTSIGKTILMPMAVYSHKYKSLDEVAPGSKVTIPNDPSNGARALLLLQQAGLIKLKEGVGFKATVNDVVENPKNLKFKELEAAQLPRSLADVDLAVITMNYVMSSGMDVKKQGLFWEKDDEPLAVMVLAAREKDKDKAEYKKIAEIFHSEAVKKFIEEKFKGTIVPAK